MLFQIFLIFCMASQLFINIFPLEKKNNFYSYFWFLQIKIYYFILIIEILIKSQSMETKIFRNELIIKFLFFLL